MFLLVLAYPGCPGPKAVKWLCVCVCVCVCACACACACYVLHVKLCATYPHSFFLGCGGRNPGGNWLIPPQFTRKMAVRVELVVKVLD